MDIPSIVCIILLVVGLFKPVGYLMALSMALTAFGSLAVLPPQLTGGTSLVAGTVGTLFVVLRTLMSPGGAAGLIEAATDRRRLGLLTTFTIVAVVSAMILPTIFQGTVNVFTLRTTISYRGTEPVAPSVTNITQAVYLIVSFFVAASYCWLATRPRFVGDFSRAVVVGAATLVCTGIVDMVASSLGMLDSLSIFRNASYAFLVAAEVQGVKRIVGLMPEASAFGGWSTFLFSLLLFTRNMYPKQYWWRVVAPLTAACALFAVLSTSSSAYLALGVTLALFGIDGARGMLFGNNVERSQKTKELMTVIGLFVVLVFFSLLFESTRETMFKIFDQMVVRKTESSSFVERSLWTSTAFEAWLGTGGLGVGVGSVRTSNFFVNILASTGFLGFGLFILFLGSVFMMPLPADRRLTELVRGAKFTLVPSFVAAFLAGTTPDYGGTNAMLFGVIVAGGALAIRSPRTYFYRRENVARFKSKAGADRAAAR